MRIGIVLARIPAACQWESPREDKIIVFERAISSRTVASFESVMIINDGWAICLVTTSKIGTSEKLPFNRSKQLTIRVDGHDTRP